jgi:hypothetical protein
MKKFPIVSNQNKENCCLGNEYLPLNYMGDFSLLGFRVQDVTEVVQLLAAGQYPVTPTTCGAEVTVNDARQLSEIVGMFQKNGIDFSLSDVADQVYRG